MPLEINVPEPLGLHLRSVHYTAFMSDSLPGLGPALGQELTHIMLIQRGFQLDLTQQRHLKMWMNKCMHEWLNGCLLSPDKEFVFIVSYYHFTMLVKKWRLVRFVRSNMLMPILWKRKRASERKEEKKKEKHVIYLGHTRALHCARYSQNIYHLYPCDWLGKSYFHHSRVIYVVNIHTLFGVQFCGSWQWQQAPWLPPDRVPSTGCPL